MSETNTTYLWGIDLGGTKIEGVVLEAASQKVLCRKRIPTEQEQGYHHILLQIKLLIDLLKKETGLTPEMIGIGTPGSLDPTTKKLKNSNTTCLNNQPFKNDLEKLIDLPTRMANDANCFALAETTMGAVKSKCKDAQLVFGVIMGTGVGGGVVINNQVINGRQGIGGEWGHNFLDESGGNCYCGKVGCVETVISGPGTQKFYTSLSGKKLNLKEIYQLYKNNDPHASAAIDRLLEMFGKGISTIINILDPDVIVLGGGVGNIKELSTEGVERVKKYVFNNRLDTVFLQPELGDSAGVFGAAMLCTSK